MELGGGNGLSDSSLVVTTIVLLSTGIFKVTGPLHDGEKKSDAKGGTSLRWRTDFYSVHQIFQKKNETKTILIIMIL